MTVRPIYVWAAICALAWTLPWVSPDVDTTRGRVLKLVAILMIELFITFLMACLSGGRL